MFLKQAFVEDVIAHQADLRYLSMCANRFMEQARVLFCIYCFIIHTVGAAATADVVVVIVLVLVVIVPI